MQLQRANIACSTQRCQAAATFQRPLLRRRVVSSVVTAPASTNVGWDASPGGYETSWYAWPEGYLGQGFNLLGKMEPRATGLADDLNILSLYSFTRREESQFSEHTITSAEDASVMVSAVVGANVDAGLAKAGGSASFEMYQNYKSNTVSHNLVASFQQNCMLERNRLPLSDEAKGVLKEMGPDEFRARYGTHFVCGVGYRGAFIGSINVRILEKSQTLAAGLSFKAQYEACSATADLKAKMSKANIDTEVMVEWSKWGVDADESLDDLQENCASDDASFAAIRQLAMQTADRAVGYPKLIKLRPYSTLPDYVEACAEFKSTHTMPQLLDQEDALAFLTDRYRRAAYIVCALEKENRAGVGQNNMSSVETNARKLVAEMESAFVSEDALANLQAYFEYQDAIWHSGDMPPAAVAGRALYDRFNEVLKLDLMLFKYIHKPVYPAAPTVLGSSASNPPRSVHVAVASYGSETNPFGSWWLNHQEQERFTDVGFYVVTLAFQDGVLQQVGTTKRFENTEADGKVCWRYWYSHLGSLAATDCIFLAFKVGNCMSSWPKTCMEGYETVAFLSLLQVNVAKDFVSNDLDRDTCGSGSSWAVVCYTGKGVAAMRSPGRGRDLKDMGADKPADKRYQWVYEPDSMVVSEALLYY